MCHAVAVFMRNAPSCNVCAGLFSVVNPSRDSSPVCPTLIGCDGPPHSPPPVSDPWKPSITVEVSPTRQHARVPSTSGLGARLRLALSNVKSSSSSDSPVSRKCAAEIKAAAEVSLNYFLI